MKVHLNTNKNVRQDNTVLYFGTEEFIKLPEALKILWHNINNCRVLVCPVYRTVQSEERLQNNTGRMVGNDCILLYTVNLE
jgi:hypothetical protein